jgi:uncharacterized repeat protein (TIGR01451 family)
VSFSVTVNNPLNNGTPIVYSGSITDSNGLTKTSTVTNPVVSAHDLQITKTVNPSGPVAPDQVLTYTLNWSVTGNEPAPDVTIADAIPANTTYILNSCTSSCAGSNPLVWSLGTQNPGASGSVSFRVTVNNPLNNGTLIVNSGTITDATGITRTSTVTNPLQSGHDLQIIKTVDPVGNVSPGMELRYTLAWSVSGNEAAANVTLSDTISANTTYVLGSCSNGCVEGSPLIWSLGDQAPGMSGTVSFSVTVNNPLNDGTVLTNTGMISDCGPVPQFGNRATAGCSGITRTSTVTNRVVSAHDLQIIKRVDSLAATGVAPGQLLTYTLGWSVSGSEVAPNVTISDSVPVSTTFVSCAVTCNSASLPAVLWPLGSQSPGATGVVTLVVRLSATPLVSGTRIANRAVITDSSGITRTDVVTVSANTGHTLFIDKVNEPAGLVQAGQIVTYSLNYSVTGNEPALGVVLRDVVPANTTLQSCSGTGAACPSNSAGSPVTWTLGTLIPPTNGSVRMVVRVNDGVISGTQIVNTGLISDSTTPTRTDTVTNPVVAAGIRIVKYTNGFDADTMADPRPILRYRAAVTWTYVVTNTGAVTLTNVGVVDDREGTISCPATQLAPYAAMVCVRVGIATTLGVYTNTATATGTPPVGPVVTSSNRSHYEVPHVLASKTAAPGTGAIVRAGDLITYTIWVTAASSVPLLNVPITDSIPTGTSYVAGSAVPAVNSGPNPLVWVLETMQPGVPYSVSFSVIVLGANEAGGILNVAYVGNNPVTPTNEIVHFFAPTAIELSSFTASRGITAGGGPIVTVRWVVGSEANTLGYRVFRGETNNRGTEALVTGGVIAATGTGGSYAWVDAAAAIDRTYYYWLQEIELDGRTVTEYGPAAVGPAISSQNRLYLPAIRR